MSRKKNGSSRLTTFALFLSILFGSAVLIGACGPGSIDGGILSSQQNQNNAQETNGLEAERVVLDLRHAEMAPLLQPNQVAAIELPCNASTGYLWEVTDLDTSKLQVLGSEIVEENNGLLGAPGKQVFYVAGIDAGRAEIRFDHRRPFVAERPLETARFSLELAARFSGQFTPPVTNVPFEPAAPTNSLRATLPAYYNWCDNGGCTPVKDQGNCGSCWAFSTVGAFESTLKINDGVTKDLSEQYLISCNSEGWGCNGGFFAHDYHISKKVSGETSAGAALESSFPYQAYDASCNPPHAKTAQLQSWTYITGSSSIPSVDQIKNAIYNYGPVSAAMCAGTSAFDNYSGGIYTYNCTQVDHAIVLVGWDDTDGVWYLRNSWGPSWGENGYMRIKYGVSKVGYGANYVVYQSQNQNTPPLADFDASINGLAVSFSNTSSDADGSIASSSWNFGDGSSSSSQNPSHTYAASGTYTVTLTVTDNDSATDSISKYVTVSGGQPAEPAADFNYSAQGLAVSFSDASNAAGGTLTDWSWNFGDGASSSAQNPSHTYAAEGTYAVSLTVTTTDSQTDSITKNVAVQVAPISYCDSASNSCSYEYIKNVQVDSFSNTSSAQTYTDFTDQVIALSSGQHNISLTPGFQSSSYTEYYKVWIDLDQNGDFSGSGEELFSAHGKTAVSGTINIPASAAQGQTRMRIAMRYNANPSSCGSFDYGEVEDYAVEFSSGGNSVPTADFSGSVSGLTVSFTDQSSDQGSTISAWAWAFGDGATSSTRNPTHTYAAAGTYSVNLTVSDANGISDQASASVTVSAPPDNGITVLDNGVPIGGVAASTGQWQHFKIVVPADASNLVMTIAGSNGDADLYTRFGAQPSSNTFDCRPYLNGSNETCSVASPSAGEYYVSVNAYAAYSGLTVTASFDEGGGPSDDGLPNGTPVGPLAAAKGQWNQFHIDVPAGASNLVFQISGGTGDADLYVRFGAEPSTSQYDCRPYLNGNSETCTTASPQAGTYYVGVRAYKAYSGVTLQAGYTP